MKRGLRSLLVLVVFGLIFASLVGIVSAACPSDIVSYWQLDEGSGSTANDPISNNDGRLRNSPVWTTGQVNGALDFSGNNGYVDIRGGMQFAANEEITIAAWIFTGPLTHEDIFGGCNDPNDNCYGRDYDALSLRRTGPGLIYADPNKLMFGIHYSRSVGSYSSCLYVSNNDVPFNQWVHVAAVYDPNNNDAGTRLYINGQSVSRIRDCTNPQPRTINLFPSIGALAWGDGRISGHSNYFDGQIDELAIFNRALSAAEISLLHEKSLAEKDYCYSDCSSGETSCIGTDYLTCDNGWSWTNNGEVGGNCGVPMICPSGMVSYWTFNESSGNTASDFIRNNDGTLNNMDDSDWVDGRSGNALEFDGVDDYVEVADNGDIFDITTGEQMSIAVWINFSSGRLRNSILGKGTDIRDLFLGADNIEAGKVEGCSGIGLCATSDNALNDEEWHYLVYVVDDVSNEQALWVDGVKQADTETVTPPLDNSDPLIIGDGPAGQLSDYWEGLIDELAIYDRALTPTEIQDSYNKGLTGKGYCEAPGAPTGDIYWANMLGEKIGTDVGVNAQKGDTVMMIWENTGLSEGTEVDFTIEELSLVDEWVYDSSSPIKGVVDASGDVKAKWIITEDDYEKTTQHDRYIFHVQNLDSNELTIEENPVNSPPIATIINPSMSLSRDNRRFKVGDAINFEKTVEDEDDDLEVIWNFDDGNTKTCINSQEDCDTVYSYSGFGTKVVKLTAKEIGRSQEDNDYTRVFIYDIGINIFALITDPIFGEIFGSGARVIQFNASESYIADCTTGSCSPPHGETCYDVGPIGEELNCYDLDKSYISTDYELWFDWTFSEPGDDGGGRYGNWTDNYDYVAEFKRPFFEPKTHWANLKVGYEDK
jgi:hypothetical protein